MDPNRLAAEKAKATRAAAKAQTDAAEKAERNRRRAHQLFLSAVPYLGTPAETYLVGRALDFPGAGLDPPGAIRFHNQVYCAETRSKLPAMVASIVHMDGRHLGTHRTWLQPNGNGKASLIEPKKSLGKLPGRFHSAVEGQAQVLDEGSPARNADLCQRRDRGRALGRARQAVDPLHRRRLAVEHRILELPAHCPVHILGQRDEKMKAIEAFASSVARLQERGHKVFLIYPPEGVKDYNDLLRRDAAVGGNEHG
jgi:hypothetical protein